MYTIYFHVVSKAFDLMLSEGYTVRLSKTTEQNKNKISTQTYRPDTV